MKGRSLKSGSCPGSPFFLYLLLSFRCRKRRTKLNRSRDIIYKHRGMRYRYYTCACMHMYLTYLREVGVGVWPLCSPVMFDLGVAHKPHNEDDGQKPAELICVMHFL